MDAGFKLQGHDMRSEGQRSDDRRQTTARVNSDVAGWAQEVGLVCRWSPVEVLPRVGQGGCSVKSAVHARSTGVPARGGGPGTVPRRWSGRAALRQHARWIIDQHLRRGQGCRDSYVLG